MPGKAAHGLPIVDAGSPAGRPEAAERARDIRDDDLMAVLTDFYDRVAADDLLASYFVPVDMAAHMPRIVDFWSTLVFGTRRYTGNAFRPHLAMEGLTAAHFARWLRVMEATVDAHGAGPAADRMKALAHRIAFNMQLRLGIAPPSGP